MKQEAGGPKRKSSPLDGGNPLLGNANNPNMANIPEHRTTSVTPTLSSKVRLIDYCVCLSVENLIAAIH